MLLQTMTYAEMRRELDRERDSFNRRAIEIMKSYEKYMRKTNKKKLDEVIDFKSRFKNRCYLRIVSENGHKNLSFQLFYLLLTRRNYSVIHLDTIHGTVKYFSSHFFTRVGERLNLKERSPLSLLFYFFRNINGFGIELGEEVEKGVFQSQMQCDLGMCLGYYHREINFIENRTFLSNNMLTGSKLELSLRLEKKYQLHCVRHKPDDMQLSSNQAG